MKFKIFSYICIASSLVLISCSHAPEKDKETALLHMQIGTSHLTNGNYPQALRELQLAHEIDDTNPLIENNLGLVYFVREKYELAEKQMQYALKLNPKYSDARNNLARIHIEMGLYDQAIQELEIVLADLTYPAADKAWVNLGMAYFKKQNFKMAKIKLAEAIRLSRNHCLAHTLYGRSELELGQLQTAAVELDRAISFCKDSSFDEPNYYSGISYFRLGQKEKAIARMEEVVQLYPQGKYVGRAKTMINEMKK